MQDPNIVIENGFLEKAKVLSFESGNPRYAMKAAGLVRDVKEVYKSEKRNVENIVAYKKLIMEYVGLIDYEVGK